MPTPKFFDYATVKKVGSEEEGKGKGKDEKRRQSGKARHPH